jgi:hypothetical protein
MGRDVNVFKYVLANSPYETETTVMLVSHRKQFIFTKTAKTAGTSVESYFEQYCMPDGAWQESHYRDEYVSESGIIGYRGPGSRRATYFNHMPAKRIRELVGEDIWHRYFKFTVVRNPFDKLVSHFFWVERRKQKSSVAQRLVALGKRALGSEPRLSRRETDEAIERFRCWVRETRTGPDRERYMIDSRECVDYFIRFEELGEGIKHVCDRLRIPFEPTRIPTFKKGIRPGNVQLSDLYDRETEKIVQELYDWELERFGYELPK